MGRYFSLVAAGFAIVCAGAVQGTWSGRWGASADLDEAVAGLERIPHDIGDWSGTDLTLEREEVKAAQIVNYCYRRYENARSRVAITVLLACGRPGPIAVHTPDVCFQGAGYERLSAPALFRLAYGTSEEEAAFSTFKMRQRETDTPTELRVFWSWNGGGPWQAPDNPRVAFARHRVLFKLYVLRAQHGEAGAAADDPCAEFLRVLLPELDAALRKNSDRPDRS